MLIIVVNVSFIIIRFSWLIFFVVFFFRQDVVVVGDGNIAVGVERAIDSSFEARKFLPRVLHKVEEAAERNHDGRGSRSDFSVDNGVEIVASIVGFAHQSKFEGVESKSKAFIQVEFLIIIIVIILPIETILGDFE